MRTTYFYSSFSVKVSKSVHLGKNCLINQLVFSLVHLLSFNFISFTFEALNIIFESDKITHSKVVGVFQRFSAKFLNITKS